MFACYCMAWELLAVIIARISEAFPKCGKAECCGLKWSNALVCSVSFNAVLRNND